jgi:hypothetical protein
MLAKQKGYLLARRLFKHVTSNDNVDPQKVLYCKFCKEVYFFCKQVIHHKNGSKLLLVENIKTEEDVFMALGLKYIEPQHRTHESAIQVAAKRSAPYRSHSAKMQPSQDI